MNFCKQLASDTGGSCGKADLSGFANKALSEIISVKIEMNNPMI